MTRQTSIDAFNEIKSNGLLSLRRWEVYECVFNNGPISCRDAVKLMSKKHGLHILFSFSSFTSRFSELQRAGVLKEVGETMDGDTKHRVILWDVTSSLPKKLKNLQD